LQRAVESVRGNRLGSRLVHLSMSSSGSFGRTRVRED
jgi:hypothetical protein